MKPSVIRTSESGIMNLKVYVFLTLFLTVVLLSGCQEKNGEAALDSDANGYLCLSCNAKFYTDRKIFANQCPACAKPNIEMVLGFVCNQDNHVTYAPRGKGFVSCEQCRKTANNINIPREKDLKIWGASYKSASEVGIK